MKVKNLGYFVQPLADAIHYKNNEVIKLLEKHGARMKVCRFISQSNCVAILLLFLPLLKKNVITYFVLCLVELVFNQIGNFVNSPKSHKSLYDWLNWA